MLPEEIETIQKTKQRKYCIAERLRNKCSDFTTHTTTTHEMLCSISLNDVNSSFVSIAIVKQYPDKRQPQVEQVYFGLQFQVAFHKESINAGN